MKFAALALALLLTLAPAAIVGAAPVDQQPTTPVQIATGPNAELISNVYQAVVLLYAQDENGGMHFVCTATAYRKVDKGYRFASASHCVSGETDQEEKATQFFITSDKRNKMFLPATLIEAGDRYVGDDFSIFMVETDVVFPVIPLGDDKILKLNEEVIDIAAPMGLGKQYFDGYISSLHVDRPPIEADQELKWTDVMLVMIGVGPGSSGSAIVSVQQKAIVGFLVGHNPGAQVGAIIVPVSKFKDFEKKVDEKTYQKTKGRNFLERLLGRH